MTLGLRRLATTPRMATTSMTGMDRECKDREEYRADRDPVLSAAGCEAPAARGSFRSLFRS